MNHRNRQRKLNRDSEHRRAMQRNLVQSLFEHGEIRTTLPKAKLIKPFAERLITLARRAKNGDLIARRRINRLMGERSFIAAEHRADYEMLSDAKRDQVMRSRSGRRHRTGAPKGKLAFTAESITRRLIETVAPRFEDRPGGYTRLIRLPDRRLGDASPLAVIQLVGEEQAPGSFTKPEKTARRRRADARYAAAVKAIKASGKSRAAAPKPPAPAPESESPPESTE
jgi:large subunit ribosomal protein L17